MHVTVVTESRFAMLPDGSIWTQSAQGGGFWERYTGHFERVFVLARCASVDQPPTAATRLAHGDITLVPLPHYIGPTQMLRRLPWLYGEAGRHLLQPMAYILRVPSWLGVLSTRAVMRRNAPFAVEVVADPYDTFGPGGVRHPARPFFRWLFPRELRLQCRRACAAAYVTERALQRRYPPAPTSFTTHYSSIELPDAAFTPTVPSVRSRGGPVRIVTVCSLELMSKGTDVLIDAVAAIVDAGMDLHLTVVGGGRHLAELKIRARDRGLGDKSRFLGQVPRAEVFRVIDDSDLFVLPSRQEGLPRAIIEAMARGKPCIGTTVGGTPELLEPDDMVPPNDVQAVAAKIREIAHDSARLQKMACRNLQKAWAYSSAQLAPRRKEFYEFVREHTAEHYKYKSDSGRQPSGVAGDVLRSIQAATVAGARGEPH
jgi:glycosyltransferase involved in cell wall biosynthesis